MTTVTPTLIDAFINCVTAGKRNETPAAYRAKLRYLTTWLGDQSITQDAINQWRLYMLTRQTHRRGGQTVKTPLSAFTIRSCFATVRHFLRWGCEAGHWPAIELQQVKPPPVDPKPVTADTIDAVIRAALVTGEPWEQIRNILILYLLRDTGARVSEISRIDISDIDLPAGVITTQGKGGEVIRLWLSPMTVTALKAWLLVRSTLQPSDYHLLTGARGNGLSRQGITRMLNRLADAAGVQYDRHNPHAWRHAFARDCLTAGADLTQVSQMMHHKSIVITAQYYARWDDAELQAAHARFSPGRNLPDPTRQGSAKP